MSATSSKVYMKIDVESSTIDCLDSLAQSQRDPSIIPSIQKSYHTV